MKIGIAVVAVVAVVAVLVVMAVGNPGYRRVPTEFKRASIGGAEEQKWQDLAGARIFFGHQSVGHNLMEGVSDVLEDHPGIELNVVETKDPGSIGGPVFAHGAIGRNTVPGSKFDEFGGIVAAEPGPGMDIVMMKLCYVDLMHGADPEEVFERYRSTVEEVRGRAPGTTILHVTTPLATRRPGMVNSLKARVKNLLGRPTVATDNAVRQQYNELLRSEYSGTDPIFDLALQESIGLDGRQNFVGKGPLEVASLEPGFTYDGGHLNSAGRRAIAEQLLITLAEVAHETRSTNRSP